MGDLIEFPDRKKVNGRSSETRETEDSTINYGCLIVGLVILIAVILFWIGVSIVLWRVFVD